MPVITIVFGKRRRLIGLPDSFDSLMRKVRDDFNLNGADFLVYVTPPFATEEVELDSSAYDAVSDKCVLRLEQIATGHAECTEIRERCTRRNRTLQAESRFGISVKTMTGKALQLQTSPSMTIGELKSIIQDREGIPPEQQALGFEGSLLSNDRTVAECSIVDGSMIFLILTLRGGKPAIYLMSPTPLDSVSVEVTLSHHWKFTTLWPLEEPSVTEQTSRVNWDVSTRPDGTLKSLGNDIESSYLFWEAEADVTTNSSDIKRSPSDTYPFNPQRPQLTRVGIDALILPFDDFMPYLYWVLESLTLTTAMRTEFIVYWLPKFQKIRDRGLDIVFDFVRQADFEKVANLDVTPKPKTVARVFLLFDGVAKQSHDQKKTLAEMKDIDWPARIGIDVEGMKNGNAFRVLEWGGMEAHMC